MAVSKFGKLTGVVNNAHASKQKPLMELTEDDWSLSMGTGLKGTLNFMKAAYPELKKTKGAIVNFGSGAALTLILALVPRLIVKKTKAVMRLPKKRFEGCHEWRQTSGQKRAFVSILFVRWH